MILVNIYLFIEIYKEYANKLTKFNNRVSISGK